MRKHVLEKVIRRAVVAAVGAVFFGSTFVVGNTLKVMIFGDSKPEAEEIAVSFPSPSPQKAVARPDRRPASPAPARPVYSSYSDQPDSGSQMPSRSLPSMAVVSLERGGEEAPFMENFAQFLNTGEWPQAQSQPQGQRTSPSSASSSLPGGIGGFSGSSAGNGASGSSSSTTSPTGNSGGNGGGGSSGGSPTVNIQPPFFASSPTAGMSGMSGGYAVSVTATGSLSAVHGTTSGGYNIWLNEAAQQAAP